MTHLLVTNDFPPKVGGIQTYLHELWKRLPSERSYVLTRDYPGAEDFDAALPHRVERLRRRTLWPSRALRDLVRSRADSLGANLVVLDPVFPLGVLGPRLGIPYALVIHGAELVVPARLPIVGRIVRRTIERADLLVVGGRYPEDEIHRLVGPVTPPVVLVPPGVDSERFRPLDDAARIAARRRLGVAPDAILVGSVSRLVPRKGMDVLVEAAGRLAGRHPLLEVVIGGTGRDERRLRRLIARTGAPVRLLGRVAEEEMPDLVACCDVWAVVCRTRWLGLEQEGFGIVFLEGAAAGVVQLAGRSGGAQEAVLDGRTGVVVDRPADTARVTEELGRLLGDAALRRRLGNAARERAVIEFSYDRLAAVLDDALVAHER